MRSLIWKEWREQGWKVGFSSAVLVAFALIGLRARIVSDEAMVLSVCAIAIALLPVLAATGLIAAERGEGSWETLLALPVKPSRILLAKTFLGVALCAVPLGIAALASLAMAGGREMESSAMLALYGRSILSALALFAWMLALTARLPNEARAAMIAIGMLIFWLLASAGLAARGMPDWAIALSPFGFLYRDSVGWASEYGIGNTARLFQVGYNFEGSNRYNSLYRSFVTVAWMQLVIAMILWLWAARQMTMQSEEKS